MTEHANGQTRNEPTDREPEEDAETSSSLDLEKDMVFELLKNHRRRSVLTHLREHGETALGDLAEAIAAEENNTTVEELAADERKRVYIGLYQTHLPKMDGAGVVTYDQNRGVVSSGPAMDKLLRHLETTEPDEEDAEADASSVAPIDLSALEHPVTLPAWGLLVTVLMAGLVTVAATALPGPVWAAVLVLSGIAATWLVRWQ